LKFENESDPKIEEHIKKLESLIEIKEKLATVYTDEEVQRISEDLFNRILYVVNKFYENENNPLSNTKTPNSIAGQCNTNLINMHQNGIRNLFSFLRRNFSQTQIETYFVMHYQHLKNTIKSNEKYWSILGISTKKVMKKKKTRSSHKKKNMVLLTWIKANL